MVPAMLAGLVGDAKFSDAHGGGSGNVEVDAFSKRFLLKRRRDERRYRCECVYE
jgi:hypothetical protein